MVCNKPVYKHKLEEEQIFSGLMKRVSWGDSGAISTIHGSSG
jgi:hypothetical protein